MALTSFHLRLANWIDRTQGASRICLNPLSFGHRFGAYVVIAEATISGQVALGVLFFPPPIWV